MIKWLKNKYTNWKLERQLNKEIDSTIVRLFDTFEAFREEQEAVKSLYQEGLTKLTNKVNEKAKEKDRVKVLEEIDFNLAEGDNPLVVEQLKQLKEVFIFKKEKPKEQMIEDRISQYYKLQKYNEERNLIKAIKAARKEGDEKRASRLEKEWRAKYRPFKES